MINQSKPTPSVTNQSKQGLLTWGNITTTWATETLTWFLAGINVTNQPKATGTTWDDLTDPWSSYAMAWSVLGGSDITNQAKP